MVLRNGNLRHNMCRLEQNDMRMLKWMCNVVTERKEINADLRDW